MNLLIDMGNSRLKWGLFENGKIISGYPVIYTKNFKEQLLSLWKEIEHPRNMVISCVNELGRLSMVQQVALQFWPNIEIIKVKSLAEGYGVENAYRNPEKLGVDRWLALLAVRKYYSCSTCVVDCGTAVTIDLLDEEGQHLGGVIAPGLTLMKKSLAGATQDLDFFESEFPLGLADNTEAAIYSGTLFSIVGLIEHIMSQNLLFKLILTGGDAEIVAKELSVDAIVRSDLVLQGLAVIITSAEN
jgi:type III pantothenate kinase